MLPQHATRTERCSCTILVLVLQDRSTGTHRPTCARKATHTWTSADQRDTRYRQTQVVCPNTGAGCTTGDQVLTQGGSLLRKTTARGGGGCRVELTGKRRRANLCKLRAVAGQAAASAGMTHTQQPLGQTVVTACKTRGKCSHVQVTYNGAVTAAQNPHPTWQGKCVRCRPEVTHSGDMPPSRAVVGSAEQAGPGRWGDIKLGRSGQSQPSPISAL